MHLPSSLWLWVVWLSEMQSYRNGSTPMEQLWLPAPHVRGMP
jgi:hypothetical protein